MQMQPSELVSARRAPQKERPAIITKMGKRIIANSGPGAELVRRAKMGEKGGLPPLLPQAFVEDVAQWALVWLHSEYGHLADRGPLNYQEDLADHWPQAWVLWMFGTIGFIDYDPQSED